MTNDISYWLGKHKSELDTPCLAIDLDLLESNLAQMQRHASAAGKRLRPHVKTHKCPAIARRQIEHGAIGLCAAKVSEAEVLIEQGFNNVLITGPLAHPGKIVRYVDCVEQDATSMLVIDDLESGQTLNAALAEAGVKANILVDVNVGQNRTGVEPSEVLALASRLAELPNLQLAGLQAYAGHTQHMITHRARREASLGGLQRAVEALVQCREAGLPCDIFTGSGTGTYDIDIEVAELTELQTGSYALMDADYRRIGSAAGHEKFEDFHPALTLLTQVVSVRQTGFVTVDAGLKAIYRDGPAPLVLHNEHEWEYGWFGDEYGRISLIDGVPNAPALPRRGEMVELIVSHVDPTVNLFDQFFVTQNDLVVDVWDIALRGKSQ